jgi:hypothetical protein
LPGFRAGTGRRPGRDNKKNVDVTVKHLLAVCKELVCVAQTALGTDRD